jgi:hypothetical protein
MDHVTSDAISDRLLRGGLSTTAPVLKRAATTRMPGKVAIRTAQGLAIDPESGTAPLGLLLMSKIGAPGSRLAPRPTTLPGIAADDQPRRSYTRRPFLER